MRLKIIIRIFLWHIAVWVIYEFGLLLRFVFSTNINNSVSNGIAILQCFILQVLGTIVYFLYQKKEKGKKEARIHALALCLVAALILILDYPISRLAWTIQEKVSS